MHWTDPIDPGMIDPEKFWTDPIYPDVIDYRHVHPIISYLQTSPVPQVDYTKQIAQRPINYVGDRRDRRPRDRRHERRMRDHRYFDRHQQERERRAKKHDRYYF